MWKSLFTYGCDIWEEDFEVWEEENGYSCSIEGLIYYDSLDKAIGYYEQMRTAFLIFLMNKGVKIEDITLDNSYIYKTYVIEIFQGNLSLTDVEIFTNCPTYRTIEEVYLWLVGVINQLEDIKIKE